MNSKHGLLETVLDFNEKSLDSFVMYWIPSCWSDLIELRVIELALNWFVSLFSIYIHVRYKFHEVGNDNLSTHTKWPTISHTIGPPELRFYRRKLTNELSYLTRLPHEEVNIMLKDLIWTKGGKICLQKENQFALTNHILESNCT